MFLNQCTTQRMGGIFSCTIFLIIVYNYLIIVYNFFNYCLQFFNYSLQYFNCWLQMAANPSTVNLLSFSNFSCLNNLRYF